jgi:voltage-gated potassium channel Kch
MKRIKTAQGTVKVDGVYTSEASARAAAARWNLWIVMGDATDDGVELWTVKPRDAARLEKAGYEIARAA